MGLYRKLLDGKQATMPEGTEHLREWLRVPAFYWDQNNVKRMMDQKQDDALTLEERPKIMEVMEVTRRVLRGSRLESKALAALSNAFGVPANKDANCWMLLVNDLCQQAVSDKRLVLHSSGLQRRDFVTLTDVGRAISHLLNLDKEQVGDGLFNVGGVWTPSIADMAELIQSRCNELLGFKPDLIYSEKAAKEVSLTIDYRIEKLMATDFSLTGNPVTEIDDTLELCRKINDGAV